MGKAGSHYCGCEIVFNRFYRSSISPKLLLAYIYSKLGHVTSFVSDEAAGEVWWLLLYDSAMYNYSEKFPRHAEVLRTDGVILSMHIRSNNDSRDTTISLLQQDICDQRHTCNNKIEDDFDRANNFVRRLIGLARA